MQQASGITFKELICALNEQLEEPYKFELDKIISSAPYKTTILGYADSIINDTKIIPNELRIQVLSSIVNINICKWINKRLYMEMLHLLLQGKLSNINTLWVRMRIAANMSLKMMINLTKEEIEELRQHMNDVFYKRYNVIANYYSIKIVQLPF